MLTAYPCADKHNDVLENCSNKNISSHLNHTLVEKTDLCSPFCVCNCCGLQTLMFLEIESFQFLAQFKEIKTSISFYKSTLFSNFYGNIWQPPQLL